MADVNADDIDYAYDDYADDGSRNCRFMRDMDMSRISVFLPRLCSHSHIHIHTHLFFFFVLHVA